MSSNMPITELSRSKLLKFALEKLKLYREKNADAVNEDYNFSHLPYELEDLADLVFLRAYKPLHGLFPSSHYVCQVNTMIEGIETRLAQYQKNNPIIDPVITDLEKQFDLSINEVNTLKNVFHMLMDEQPATECLSQVALSIMRGDTKLDSDISSVELSIKLIENALDISKKTASEVPAKRYAFLLAEIYANARRDSLDKVEINFEKSLTYIQQAAEHGSVTAQGLLSQENPVLAMLEMNGIFVNQPNKNVISSLSQQSFFAQPESQSRAISEGEIKNTNTF